MPLSAVIVDDEQLARDELAYLLKNVDDVNVVAQGKNGVEAVNLIREHNPDLVFLDVQMPGLDGFGVIKKLAAQKFPLPQIVFATAYDQYAVKAFEVNAVDYVLKPFDKKRIEQALQKARRQRTAEPASAAEEDRGAQRRAAIPGGPERHLLCVHRRWRDHRGDRECARRPIKLPDAGGAAGYARPANVLARASLVPGEHQPHQGSRA